MIASVKLGAELVQGLRPLMEPNCDVFLISGSCEIR